MNRRGTDNPLVTAGLVTAAGYVCLCFLVQAAAHILVVVRCGGSPPSPFNPAAAVGLLVDRIDWIVRQPQGCDVGTGSVWWVIGPLLLLVAALAVGSVLAWRRWKQSGAWLRQDILKREGIAQRAEILHDFGARAVRRRGRFTRPGLVKPRIQDVAWTLGRSRGVTVHVSTEESMVIQGAPRSGKGLYVVINAILDAPGAVVTTSTRADNLVVTMTARARGGKPVTVFDPQGMSGLPSTLRWSPVRGCHDPDIATRRALVITADTEMKGENAAWQKRSLIILQCLLHAAALSGEGVRAFRRWSSSPVLAREALEVLGRPEAALGWQADLMGILEDDPRNTSNSWIGVSAAVAPLSSPKVLAALDPRDESEEFDPKSFIRDCGTLYLIGTRAGAAAAGSYLSALIDDIDNAAREMAFVSPGGRLDPPLSLILDEIANLAPWPGLPIALSDGGGIGISTLVVLQSLSQARTGWSIDEAATIWDSSIIKVIFGGGSDERDLRSLAGLLGERSLTLNTRSWSAQGRQDGEQIRESPVLPLHEIRRLPVGTALMLGRRTRPILLDLREWHKRKDAAELGRSKLELERALADGHRLRQQQLRRSPMAGHDDVERFEIPSAGADDDDLTAELFRSAFRPPARTPGVTYRWRQMTAAQAGSVWRALAIWVRWLVGTYQLTTSVVPDCWWRHSEIVAELYALQRAELASYAGDDPGFGPLAFHERLPHAVERLRIHTRTAGCVGLQAHKEPTPRILRPDAPDFVEWQAATHQIGDEF